MTVQPIWMVRAGKASENIDDFIEGSLVKFEGGAGHGVADGVEKTAVGASLLRYNPTERPGTIASWASQLMRFNSELSIGDDVTTYDSGQRLYYLGKIESNAKDRKEDGSLARQVEWRQKVARDRLLSSTRNSLGSTLTLFQLRGEAAEDMRKQAIALDAEAAAALPVPVAEELLESDEQFLVAEVASKATEFLEDRIARLSWDQMEELVAEILRAMGYRARVSPKGADRGVDIIASPDGLGLQEPRIFVEVKHRLGKQISSDMVRAFIGGRQPGDRCLYVSTGGFTKDARYEAERSTIPLTLVTLSDLRKLLTDNYDQISPTGAALIPLERIYWPVS